MLDIESLDWEKVDGLVPVIVQDYLTAKVCMLGYVNREALEATLESGYMTFFSRTRQEIWKKGETSGNYLSVVDIAVDCDNDALLAQVRPTGPVCHTGDKACFGKGAFLWRLLNTIEQRRRADPDESYVASLFAGPPERIAQKVGEEATEVVIAATAQGDAELTSESADLLFHLLVLLSSKGVELSDVMRELENRA